MKGSKRNNEQWFQVRGSLSRSRVSLLIVASFVAPLLIWSVFTYTPGLWDISYKLRITTDLTGGEYTTIYRPNQAQSPCLHILRQDRSWWDVAFQCLVVQ